MEPLHLICGALGEQIGGGACHRTQGYGSRLDIVIGSRRASKGLTTALFAPWLLGPCCLLHHLWSCCLCHLFQTLLVHVILFKPNSVRDLFTTRASGQNLDNYYLSVAKMVWHETLPPLGLLFGWPVLILTSGRSRITWPNCPFENKGMDINVS